jgi:two-component system phosphate regulon sensor histidine kinase PhoR/two-component system sensor histidine kinase VicK
MEECISMGERVVKLQSAVTHGSSETITGVVVVLQDITRAVESDRSKSAFIATASHELRTPLAGLRGFVDLFRLSGLDNLSDNQRLFLESIQRQTSNLVQLVNDLLEVARFDQGTIRAERRWVSLEETIEEVIENLQPQIDEKQIHLHIKLEPTLPLIWIDSLHLRRILLNLISNAIKYVHHAGEVRVWGYELNNPTQLPGNPIDQAWRMKEKRSVVVEIEDNGVGIPQADQDRVFQRFFRSENVLSVEAGGTGLGLAITRSLVQLHHGQIGFWSVEQEGSCFWVRLPAPTVEPLEEEQTIEQVVIT